jgi:hypothetical protein
VASLNALTIVLFALNTGMLLFPGLRAALVFDTDMGTVGMGLAAFYALVGAVNTAVLRAAGLLALFTLTADFSFTLNALMLTISMFLAAFHALAASLNALMFTAFALNADVFGFWVVMAALNVDVFSAVLLMAALLVHVLTANVDMLGAVSFLMGLLNAAPLVAALDVDVFSAVLLLAGLDADVIALDMGVVALALLLVDVDPLLCGAAFLLVNGLVALNMAALRAAFRVFFFMDVLTTLLDLMLGGDFAMRLRAASVGFVLLWSRVTAFVTFSGASMDFALLMAFALGVGVLHHVTAVVAFFTIAGIRVRGHTCNGGK